uniref:Uncharacterized protein n=1 Tax=Timema cristinae TaxID=61476 RepID=A0A7R9CG65_TIMCR|nr:unnamed protein product [Timema cristinae]
MAHMSSPENIFVPFINQTDSDGAMSAYQKFFSLKQDYWKDANFLYGQGSNYNTDGSSKQHIKHNDRQAIIVNTENLPDFTQNERLFFVILNLPDDTLAASIPNLQHGAWSGGRRPSKSREHSSLQFYSMLQNIYTKATKLPLFPIFSQLKDVMENDDCCRGQDIPRLWPWLILFLPKRFPKSQLQIVGQLQKLLSPEFGNGFEDAFLQGAELYKGWKQITLNVFVPLCSALSSFLRTCTAPTPTTLSTAWATPQIMFSLPSNSPRLCIATWIYLPSRATSGDWRSPSTPDFPVLPILLSMGLETTSLTLVGAIDVQKPCPDKRDVTSRNATTRLFICEPHGVTNWSVRVGTCSRAPPQGASEHCGHQILVCHIFKSVSKLSYATKEQYSLIYSHSIPPTATHVAGTDPLTPTMTHVARTVPLPPTATHVAWTVPLPPTATHVAETFPPTFFLPLSTQPTSPVSQQQTSDGEWTSSRPKPVTPEAEISGITIVVKRRKKRVWSRNLVLKRNTVSHTVTILPELDADDFRNYLRMNEDTYKHLLSIVSHRLTKQDTVMRKTISCLEKLSVTLRFLAIGRSYKDLRFSSAISQPALTYIIPETCQAIVDGLIKDVMQRSSSAACDSSHEPAATCLKTADKKLTDFVCECAYNTLKGRLPLKNAQKTKLRSHKQVLRKLVKRGECWK